MPNVWDVKDYPYAGSSNPYAAQQPTGYSGGSGGSGGGSAGSSSGGQSWPSPHPPNAAYTSDDGLISYDAGGYQLDSLGNRAFGSWPNSSRGNSSTAQGTSQAGQWANWNPQMMGGGQIPNYSLDAWGRPANYWLDPNNVTVANNQSNFYLPWQQQMYNQYTTGMQRNDALGQWGWQNQWGALGDLYNMQLAGVQTYGDLDLGYAGLEQNALANMYDYNLGMGTLANDQYRTSAEAYGNLYRPYMEAGANMYNSDVNAMLGLGDQSQGWAKLGQDYQLGIADMENQQLLESMRQFGRNQAPNVRALRNWY